MSEKKIRNIFMKGAIAPIFIADSISKHSLKTDIGGHGIFMGQVRRDQIGNKFVSAIEFTAFETLALEKMQLIRESIFQKYPLKCMHIYHSLGRIKVGEICFFVFTSAAHRKPAIDACAEVVERIKTELPIWGKEIFEDETHQWKENN
ncbi:molybdenum cofactor biosynthesis protein MoaE [Pedobacter sp. UYP24]